MECFKIKNLSFTYPKEKTPALSDIDLSVSQGEFVTVCGKSGCGKTTLLRLLKPAISPFGSISGSVCFDGRLLSELSEREQAVKIGFVMQSPDNQLVTDKVWHELAFGLESLGMATSEIRARVAETASFFGIQNWFHKNVSELSGGQKQLLNLASVMVMQPSVLILDEPASQLDPIAAQEFFKNLEKINRELGTTVLLSEHRLEEALPLSDRAVVMDGGRIIANASPKETARLLRRQNHDMFAAFPTPMRIYGAVEKTDNYPLSVREGKAWLEGFAAEHTLDADFEADTGVTHNTAEISETAVEVRDAFFRYKRELPDVIKGMNVKIRKGELFAILGGNGSGKTTALSLISGLNTPYRGKVLINGEEITRVKNLHGGVLSMLPQNPQSLFVKNTVYLDLCDMLSESKLSQEEKRRRIKETAQLCRIGDLLERHPYDLSGGEQQRAALAKVLLTCANILLLDEPTKGFDAHFKEIFADILCRLKAEGKTVIMVSHDIEFCAEYADRCALFFDGNITSVGKPREFFAGKSFYTTCANRMARNLLPRAVLAEDVIRACGAVPPQKRSGEPPKVLLPDEKSGVDVGKKRVTKLTPKRLALGILFAILFALTCIYASVESDGTHEAAVQLVSVAEVAACFLCFFGCGKEGGIEISPIRGEENPVKRTAAGIAVLIAVPLTVIAGIYLFDDRKYYFISLLIILETLIPFFMLFENRKPRARELVVISVLCAVAVAGRAAFYMLPQFKPAAAVIIISGVCFGAEVGFAVGAVTGFVSNFFFGQGPWTPWQMLAFGIIGFAAGIIFGKGLIKSTRTSLCVFGGLSVLIIYGGIMNPASVLMWQAKPTSEMFISAYISGLPFDLIHALSTVFFLWFIAKPMTEKLERIKLKYGF